MVEPTTHGSRTDVPRPDLAASGALPLPDLSCDDGTCNGDVTEWLQRWYQGDSSALERLLPWVYARLHRLAESAMHGERIDHTLQATALVNEAYLRLQRQTPPDWQDRRHFYAVSARLMRRILVDHARASTAARRGGGVQTVALADASAAPGATGMELLAIDEALQTLSRLRPRQAQVLEMRFFAGFSVVETAHALGVSKQTILLDTRLGRAWLFARLRFEPPAGAAADRRSH